MRRRKRLSDGTFGFIENISDQPSLEEKVATLGTLLAQEKLSSIQKDTVINGLGAQVAQMKIEMMQLKGGAS